MNSQNVQISENTEMLKFDRLQTLKKVQNEKNKKY